MIWTLRRLARRPELALGASALIAGVTLVASAESIGKPLGWLALMTIFAGGLASGMGIAKAKRDWHDAWVRQTFTDIVMSSPHEKFDLAATSGRGATSGEILSEPSGALDSSEDRVLRLPHDGPDSDVILSLPHGSDSAASAHED